MSSAVRKIDEGNHHLVARIRAGDESAFEKLFFNYYSKLCAAALPVTKSREGARDVVQEVFLNLWETRSGLKIQVSIKAYLYKAVWNRALNHSAKKKNHQKRDRAFLHEAEQAIYSEAQDTRYRKNIVLKIWKVVQAMPERRSFVFTLHRKQGLSYKEIGEVLNISCKTVENHMGLALKEIREKIDVQL